jgi:aminocarboxymuconate-semialdehyde decarboxylase
MVVDVHAHVIPAALPAAPAGAEGWPSVGPLQPDGTRLLEAGALRFPARRAFFERDERLMAMAETGVDVEVVSPMPPLLNYALPPAAGRALSRCVNEHVARLCESAPGRLYGLGTVPLQDPDLAARELADVLAMGLHGVEIGSNAGGVSPGDDRFLGFFQEAARLGVPVFVHALGPTVGDRLPASAMATFGFATDVALAAASLVSGQTLVRCPELRLALSHGAGGFPLMLTRAEHFWHSIWKREPPGPAELARRMYYDALVFDRRALRYLLDMMGARRLLLGTDFPAMPRELPADRTLRSLDLAPDAYADVTWHNCFRFLGVEEP